MHSMQVKTMLTGYANHATELGYQKKGAMPLTEPEMQQLLGDGTLFSLLWQTCFRNCDAGGLRLHCPTLPYTHKQAERGIQAAFDPRPYKIQEGSPLQHHLELRCAMLLHMATTGRASPFSSWVVHHQPYYQITAGWEQGVCGESYEQQQCLGKASEAAKRAGHVPRSKSSQHQKGDGDTQAAPSLLSVQERCTEIAEAARCNEKNVKYYTDLHRPTRQKCM